MCFRSPDRPYFEAPTLNFFLVVKIRFSQVNIFQYAISQLRIVRSGLHLVTYLNVGNFCDKRTEKNYMKFVCKVFLDFPIPTDQANLYR